ncbi:MAG: EAL domain-containing protein [Marinobacter sp.]|uniref:EAL domain-containing protein n=1 Tax=Marinobacter sp. TaxID=50741 RepID=UPI00299CDBAA|nr:EAL domain-containing protein [Marinobacter sp.]MDX1635290.1 EAL domain-containing protein [Marinobacter sp.]
MSFPEQLFDESKCGDCACGEGLDFKFTFAFQPIVDITDQSVYAHEALVRGPEGESAWSVLSRVNAKNRYTFDQICRVKAVKLAARLGMDTYLSINFLPNAVYQAETCIRTTLAAAKTYEFDTNKLIFELTEGEELAEAEHLVSIIEAYKQMGFQVAIDDFGAGYSRLNVMMASPPNILKVDMALIRNIDREPNKQAVVNGIITMMEQLGGRIVAEGVETVAEFAWLRARGITLYQGYLFARPGFETLPAPVFPEIH